MIISKNTIFEAIKNNKLDSISKYINTKNILKEDNGDQTIVLKEQYNLNESMFSNLLVAIGSFIAGKSTNTVIKGNSKDIQNLRALLIKARATRIEQEKLMDIFQKVQEKTKDVEEQRKLFYRNTGIELPSTFLSGV